MKIINSSIPVSPSSPPVVGGPILRDIIGVNTNIGLAAAIYDGATAVTKLTWLGIDLVRDTPCWDANLIDQAYFQFYLNANIKINFVYQYTPNIGYLDIATVIARIADIEISKPGIIVGIEGMPNIDQSLSFSYGGQSGYAAWRAWFIDYYTAIKGQSVLVSKKIVGMCVADNANIINIGNISSYCDYGNLHYFCDYGEPTWGTVVDGSAETWTKDIASIQTNVCGGKPVVTTANGVTDAA